MTAKRVKVRSVLTVLVLAIFVIIVTLVIGLVPALGHE